MGCVNKRFVSVNDIEEGEKLGADVLIQKPLLESLWDPRTLHSLLVPETCPPISKTYRRN